MSSCPILPITSPFTNRYLHLHSLDPLPSTYSAVNPTERSERRSRKSSTRVSAYWQLSTLCSASSPAHLTRNGQAWSLIAVTASLLLKFKSLVIECSTQIRTDCLGLPGFAHLENLQELVVSDGTKTASGSSLIEFNCLRRDNTACNCYRKFLLQSGHRQASP